METREYRERKRFRLRAGRTERAHRVNNAFGKHRAQTNKTRARVCLELLLYYNTTLRAIVTKNERATRRNRTRTLKPFRFAYNMVHIFCRFDDCSRKGKKTHATTTKKKKKKVIIIDSWNQTACTIASISTTCVHRRPPRALAFASVTPRFSRREKRRCTNFPIGCSGN